MPTWDVDPPGSGLAARDIIAVVADACAAAPATPAIVFEDGVTISRSDLRRLIERFGGYLAKRIAPGDRVAVALENRIEFMIAWIAVVAAGGTLVSMNPASRRHDALHVLRDSSATVAIVGDSSQPVVQAVRRECSALRDIVVVGQPEPHGLDGYSDGAALNLHRINTVADRATNVYYTSGTTGRPKGCQLGHRYWLRFVDLWLRLYGMGASDRLLCCVPFFYGDAPWQFLSSLYVGSTLVAMRRFSVRRFWDVARRHGVTQLFTLASMPSLLLKAPPMDSDRDHQVRFGVHIGIQARLHHEMVARWGFPWTEGYGLTETGLVIAMPPAYAGAMTGSGSIGIPCPEVQVRLLGDDGSDTQTARSGEIAVRAPGMMLGYLNLPGVTADAIRDGWLHTGDLARRDDEGFYYFVGRKKDIIRRSGENVSATEVEEVLRAHDAVRDAAVVAVTDELRGEEIKAFVQPQVSACHEHLPAALIHFCLEHLAPHKVPRYVALWLKPLPRTPSMRVDKRMLEATGQGATHVTWDREQELGW